MYIMQSKAKVKSQSQNFLIPTKTLYVHNNN